VRASETGIANGMNAVARTVGGVVGAQIGAALLISHHVPGSSLPTHSGYVAAFRGQRRRCAPRSRGRGAGDLALSRPRRRSPRQTDGVSRARVLVVDDEHDFAALLRELLTRAGYETAGASGEDGPRVLYGRPA